MGGSSPPRFVGIVGAILGLIAGGAVGVFTLVLIALHGSEDYGSAVIGVIAAWAAAMAIMMIAGVRLLRRALRR